jgi:SAM-dependent methyltransferase
MSSWTQGYVADIGYTYGYYSELSPIRANLALLYKGNALPQQGTHCELGFGQGMSINMHAAASGDCWYGTDFNPSQVSFAQELAAVSGADVHLSDDSFAEFAQRTDLPQFDSIGLHGIWSWINDDNRAIIVDFVRRKLKVGGQLYISYNTQPGWSAFAPMRHLLTQHADVMGANGQGIVGKIDGAIDFAERLLATKPAFLLANPQVAQKLERIKGQNRQYIAHEYFNLDWEPMHFGDMHQWLSPAKLDFACSAHYNEHIDEVNLTTQQQNFLAEIEDKVFRESTRDFMTNQQFRRDIWIKGARQLGSRDRAEAIRAQRVMLTVAPADVKYQLKGSRGSFNVGDKIYEPIVNYLADYRIRSLAEVEQAVAAQGFDLSYVMKVSLALIGMGYLSLVQSDERMLKAQLACEKLNTHILQQVRGNIDYRYLASPVTGAAMLIDRVEMLFLAARQMQLHSQDEWIEFAWKVLESNKQILLKDGKNLETREENLTELAVLAIKFAANKLPVLQALKVVK